MKEVVPVCKKTGIDEKHNTDKEDHQKNYAAKRFSKLSRIDECEIRRHLDEVGNQWLLNWVGQMSTVI